MKERGYMRAKDNWGGNDSQRGLGTFNLYIVLVLWGKWGKVTQIERWANDEFGWKGRESTFDPRATGKEGFSAVHCAQDCWATDDDDEVRMRRPLGHCLPSAAQSAVRKMHCTAIMQRKTHFCLPLHITRRTNQNRKRKLHAH